MKKGKEVFMYAFAALLMLFLFTFLGLIIFKAMPVENKDLLNITAGIAFGWGSMAVSYFFGSSKGSADKTEMLNKPPTS